MKFGMQIIFIILSLVFSTYSHARDLPRRSIPVPQTVSPELAKIMGEPLPDWWQTSPKSLEEWASLIRSRDEFSAASVREAEKELKITKLRTEMGGVPVFVIEPDKLNPGSENRILLHFHGGGYVLGKGEAGLIEALYMASIGGFKIVSVDYRMAPYHPFPAALEDGIAVYKALLKRTPAANIGIFGTSTGGGLALALVLKAKQEGLPLPGAVAAGTPWTDLSETGDSYQTNKFIDNVLVGYDGWLKAAARTYAAGQDLKNPFISPVYGDVKGFPPTLLIAGTRDLFLSNTARMHRKLRENGAIADLIIIEGLSHAQYLHLGAEAAEALYYFQELTSFFEKHLKG